MRPSLKVWFRNGLIGALLVSCKALLGLIASPADRFVQRTAVLLAAAGAAAGIGFTLLTPIRRASRFGRYAVWVIAVYIVLGAITVPAALQGDEFAKNALTMPIGWLFLLGSGFVTGFFCARAAERWAKGDFR